MNFRAFILLVLLSSIGWMGSYEPAMPDRTSWKVRIAPSSELSLLGTTNVNTFECGAEQDFGRVWLDVIHPEYSQTIQFERAVLNLDVNSLHCGHEAINRDMRTTLKADQYPQISLQLLQVKLPKQASAIYAGNWQKIAAQVRLTLAGNTCTHWIFVDVRQTQENHFRIKGDHSLAFSDFKLTCPTAMMGLIKVDDIIDINFDLRLSLTCLS
jgi:hypothetical protein